LIRSGPSRDRHCRIRLLPVLNYRAAIRRALWRAYASSWSSVVSMSRSKQARRLSGVAWFFRFRLESSISTASACPRTCREVVHGRRIEPNCRQVHTGQRGCYSRRLESITMFARMDVEEKSIESRLKRGSSRPYVFCTDNGH
jgi:hypothetical protein